MAGMGHNIDGAGAEALQRIANDLNTELADDVESIFRKGRKFLEAKKGLGHGQFLRLFANHRDPLPEPVRCHQTLAQRFMKVAAKHDELSKEEFTLHFDRLPCDLDTLAALFAKDMDSAGLRVAFSEGWITPFTSKKDVKEIRIRLGIDDEPAPKRADDEASDFITKSKTKARKIIEALPQNKRGDFVFYLEAMAQELKTEIQRANAAAE